MEYKSDTSSQNITKASKRKGTRSVLTLSREQLERKRANDREAQRAIRARTKDYIDHLESELRERDKLIEELRSHNEALQEEIRRLRASGTHVAGSSPYQSGVYYMSPYPWNSAFALAASNAVSSEATSPSIITSAGNSSGSSHPTMGGPHTQFDMNCCGPDLFVKMEDDVDSRP
ncbi:hypothetical protein S7711_09570 [Stachybotrys chartarum IBT 7711]|uniref:BZIP domain-containing protein n=1 Tax=Stachybotrys chartarum (strain CBS 109288 / IBT 7711) TaxID=1280523 RepID=A0A084B814_STACB|nr:hypothetical protein S7711_09570 [Stachybotrys chartarum IBT 7711]